MRKYLTTILILILSAFSVLSQNLAMTEIGHWGQGFSVALAVDGNYAYTNSGSRFVIADISVPQAPVKIGEITLGANILDIKVQANFAYVVDGSEGLWVIDISDHKNPKKVGYSNTEGWARGLDISGNFAYIADNDKGILIFDISDPSNPVMKGSYDTPGYAYQVKVQGNYAYVADHNKGIRIIDISNPVSLKEIANYYLSEYAEFDGIAVYGDFAYIAYSGGLIVINISNSAVPVFVNRWYKEIVQGKYTKLNGDYLYLGCSSDEECRIFNISNPANPIVVGKIARAYSTICFKGLYAFVPGLTVYDVSNPANVLNVGRLNIGTSGFINGIAVRDSIAYLADHTDGLRIVNFSKLDNLQEIGWLDTPNVANNVAVNEGYAYVADGDSGLRIIDIRNPFLPKEAGYYKLQGDVFNIHIQGDYAYVAYGNAGMRILDISHAPKWTEIGFLDTYAQAYDIVVKGTYAYIADGTDGVIIVDIANKAFPKEVGHYETPGISLGVDLKDDFLIVADDGGGIIILDISKPEIPKHVWSYSENEGYYDVSIEGNFACFTNGWNGLLIFDIRDPYFPKKIGTFKKSNTGIGAITISNNKFFVGERDLSIFKIELPNEIEDDFQIKILPNPFKNNASFNFNLLTDSKVVISLYDRIGKQVQAILDKNLPAGYYNIPFSRENLSRGIYLYKFVTNGIVLEGKILIL